jgi:ASC-1-like (ASCH) protein
MTVVSFMFHKIETNEKRVEARIGIPKYTGTKVGDVITFVCGTKTVSRTIICKVTYTSFEEMLKVEGMNNCLPGVTSFKEAVEFDKLRELGTKIWGCCFSIAS